MICKDCGKIEPNSRWNKRFGKHELCEKCLREHENFKYEYILRAFKQAGIKNSCGFLTVKALLRDSHEIITIIEERVFDRLDFGMLIDEIEGALKDDVLPDYPFGDRVVRFTLCKPKYSNKRMLLLSNSKISNMIQAFYNTDSIVSIEYSNYPREMR